MRVKTMEQVQPELARTHQTRAALSKCCDDQVTYRGMVKEWREKLRLQFASYRRCVKKLAELELLEGELRSRLQQVQLEDRDGMRSKLEELKAETARLMAELGE